MKKKILLTLGSIMMAAAPVMVYADEPEVTKVKINHPVNVYYSSGESAIRGDERGIYKSNTYFIYLETEDAYNITTNPEQPGGWVNKEDITREFPSLKYKVIEKSVIYSINEFGILVPTDEILDEDTEITSHGLKQEYNGFLEYEDEKFIKTINIEDIGEYELMYLKEDIEFKIDIEETEEAEDKTKEVIGKEKKGYKVLAIKDDDNYRFVYNGHLFILDKSKLTKDNPNPPPVRTSNNTKNNNSSRKGGNPPSVNTGNIVSLAKQQVGKGYVYAGNGPDVFDCSGLTKYLFKHSRGIDIPRTAQAQSNIGSHVSFGNIQPGDLIFFGSPVYHVGIYVGDGMYVHASTPERGVVMDSIHSNYVKSNYSSIKRVK